MLKKDYHNSIDLHETKDMGTSIFTIESIPPGKGVGVIRRGGAPTMTSLPWLTSPTQAACSRTQSTVIPT